MSTLKFCVVILHSRLLPVLNIINELNFYTFVLLALFKHSKHVIDHKIFRFVHIHKAIKKETMTGRRTDRQTKRQIDRQRQTMVKVQTDTDRQI